MDAYLLTDVINAIRRDDDHHSCRRVLHENYEWLEHFWRYKYNHGDLSIDDFIRDKGTFFWAMNEIKELAKEFASIECVGSNKEPEYAQSEEIARATMYLRYHCSLFDDKTPTCEGIMCRQHKIDKGTCSPENGLLWKGRYNPISAFKALVYIVRQIRNNLFHGHKLSLDPVQYERNKILVSLASRVTEILLANLVASGG
jgi:hypothetical protein